MRLLTANCRDIFSSDSLLGICPRIKAFLFVLKNSLTNLGYYREVADVSLWFSFKYLFVLLVLSTFALVLPIFAGGLFVAPRLPGLISQAKTWAEGAYPRNLVIKTENGELSTNVPEPYIVEVPKGLSRTDQETITEGKKHLLVIDTKAAVEDYPKYDSLILVTKKAAVFPKSDSSGTQVFFLSEVKENTTLDYNSYLLAVRAMYPYLQYAEPVFWTGMILLLVAVPVLGALFSMGEKGLSLFFFSLIMLLVARVMNLKFRLGQVYRMAIHASTLPIIFFTALSLFGLNPSVPFGYSLILAVFMVMVFLTLRPKTS